MSAKGMAPKYAQRHRKIGLLWRGQVFALPTFVNWIVDDEQPRLVSEVHALTEGGIRRKLARRLWRMTHPPTWKTRLKRR